MSAQRITQRDLEGVVRRIERHFGIDPDGPTFDNIDGRWIATVGRFYLDGAYGGWALYRYVNEGGGSSDVLGVGHRPRRELYELLHAFARGLEFADDVAAVTS